MVNYAWSRRIRRKQYKRRHRITGNTRSRSVVNPGIRIRNDNMVYMKRLHRGPGQMKYNFGNPTSSNTGYLRGKQINKRYKNSKKQKIVRNSFRSEL